MSIRISRYYLLLAIAVVTISSAWLLSCHLNNEDSKVFDELKGRDNRVFLMDNEIIRVVEYHSDRISRRHATAHSTNGETTEFWYWPSGKLKEAVTFYSDVQTGKSAKKIRRKATFLKDGVTYATDFEYRVDGTMHTSTVLNQSGDHSTRSRFFEDGKVKQEELFVLRPTLPLATWYRLSSRLFHANGTLAQSFDASGLFGAIEARYDLQGRLLFTSQLSDYATDYTESWFFQDGKTLKRKVTQSTGGTNLKTFSQEGILLEERFWYGNVGEGMMKVKTFDPTSGIQLLEQLFTFDSIQRQYRPYSFSVFENGKKSLYALLFLGTPDKVKTFTRYFSDKGDLGERTTIVFDREGFVESEFRHDGTGKVVKKTEYKQGDKVQRALPPLNPEWLLMRDYTIPPKIVKFEPSPYR